jgi:uncharacterized membrane protein
MRIILLCFIQLTLCTSIAFAGEGEAFLVGYLVLGIYWALPIACLFALGYFMSKYGKTKNKQDLLIICIFLAVFILFVGYELKKLTDIKKTRAKFDLVPVDPVQRERFLTGC